MDSKADEGGNRPVGDLIDLALAYAVTCHKAQGSQAARVIVPLYETRLLEPSWLYTAITRGERQVVLVGDPDVAAKTLGLPFAASMREVGFCWPWALPSGEGQQAPPAQR